MKLSVVIPAYNEEGSICETVRSLSACLGRERIDHEILVVNDNSRDGTLDLLEKLATEIPSLRFVTNRGPNGFGFAVRKGLELFSGDCVAISMADLSDSPDDIVRFYRKMTETGAECIFGNRFMRGGRVIDYPKKKLLINRLANNLVSALFLLRYNDVTNACKLYSRQTIKGISPLESESFNLTLEMPLKAIIRGYSYVVVPNSWTNRKKGESKFRIRSLSIGYFSVLMRCLRERYLVFSKRSPKA